MSRTIRRLGYEATRGKVYGHKQAGFYSEYDLTDRYDYFHRPAPTPRPPTQREYTDKYWDIHRDHKYYHYKWGTERSSPHGKDFKKENKVNRRTAAVRQLQRWLQNPDHEIIEVRTLSLHRFYVIN